MANNIKKFYETKENKKVRQKGWIGFLYHKLRTFEKHRSDRVLELVTDKKYDSILDIGCDNGYLLLKIANKIKVQKLIGIDISSKVINQFKLKLDQYNNDIIIHNVDENIPFKDKEIDLIVMVAVLEHVFDPMFVVKEINRVLRDDGIFIVEVPNIAFIKYRFNLLFGKRPRTSWGYGWDGGHLQYFNQKDLRKLLENNGFTIMNVTGSGIFYNLRKWWGSLLLPNIIVKAKKK